MFLPLLGHEKIDDSDMLTKIKILHPFYMKMMSQNIITMETKRKKYGHQEWITNLECVESQHDIISPQEKTERVNMARTHIEEAPPMLCVISNHSGSRAPKFNLNSASDAVLPGDHDSARCLVKFDQEREKNIFFHFFSFFFIFFNFFSFFFIFFKFFSNFFQIFFKFFLNLF